MLLRDILEMKTIMNIANPKDTNTALYIYLDESGNLDFNKDTGTQYFVLSAVVTKSPTVTQSTLSSLKYQLLAQGYDIEYFHAAEDQQIVRNKVIKEIQHLEDASFHLAYADKWSIDKHKLTSVNLYHQCSLVLFKEIWPKLIDDHIQQIVVIYDKVLTKEAKSRFLQLMKSYLKQFSKQNHVYFHSCRSDANGQIADYIAWSLYVGLSRNENRPWDALQNSETVIRFSQVKF